MADRSILNVAIFIFFLTMVPRVIPEFDFNSKDPALAEMTPSAIVAVQMAAESVMPLNDLAFLFAFATVLLSIPFPADPAPPRVQRASLMVAVHCFWLSTLCLNYARMCPLTLLSFVPIFQGLMLFIALLSFFFFALLPIVRR